MMYDPLALSHCPTLITEQLTIFKQVNFKSVYLLILGKIKKKVWNFPCLQDPPHGWNLSYGYRTSALFLSQNRVTSSTQFMNLHLIQ